MIDAIEKFFTDGASQLSAPHFSQMIPRLLAATAIGAGIAIRPWRRWMHRPAPKSEMVQSQILLCVAAAVITVVIGDSVAKAFGLVGLGGFVRFRQGLKDPRDGAILFLLIGLGMACGHGSLGLAAAGATFVGVLLVAGDLLGREKSETQFFTLAAESEDPAGSELALRKALTEKNVMVRKSALDFPKKRLELELEGADPAKLSQLFAQPELALRNLKWTQSSKKPEKELREEV